jgi:hypothetical protein
LIKVPLNSTNSPRAVATMNVLKTPENVMAVSVFTTGAGTKLNLMLLLSCSNTYTFA